MPEPKTVHFFEDCYHVDSPFPTHFETSHNHPEPTVLHLLQALFPLTPQSLSEVLQAYPGETRET